MTEQTELLVSGMTCAHCSRAVSEALAALPAVESVHVDLEAGQVTVKGENLDGAALRAAILEAGYDVEP